jgi:hypothetical protein
MRTGTRAGETRDVLAPSQTRYIEVTKNGEVKVFDIEIVLSRD